MKIFQMRRRLQLKKKINIQLLLIIIGLILFSGSMIGFIINACTIQNIPLAWVLFAFIILGSGLLLFGLILYIYQNKDKIKKYLDEIM